jgi:hypothetical protein
MRAIPKPQLPPPPVHQAAPPLPLVAAVSVLVLARFRRLMVAEGWAVDLPRICIDRLYAFDRIARAHTSADPRLRDLALSLFAAYQRDSAVPLH